MIGGGGTVAEFWEMGTPVSAQLKVQADGLASEDFYEVPTVCRYDSWAELGIATNFQHLDKRQCTGTVLRLSDALKYEQYRICPLEFKIEFPHNVKR